MWVWQNLDALRAVLFNSMICVELNWLKVVVKLGLLGLGSGRIAWCRAVSSELGLVVIRIGGVVRCLVGARRCLNYVYVCRVIVLSALGLLNRRFVFGMTLSCPL